MAKEVLNRLRVGRRYVSAEFGLGTCLAKDPGSKTWLMVFDVKHDYLHDGVAEWNEETIPDLRAPDRCYFYGENGKDLSDLTRIRD